MPGIDSFTKLLLHANGTDGSTTFIDSSNSSHTVTAVSSEIDTAQSKFGGASALFSGGGSSRLYIEDSEDWNFGSGDFTVDFWIRFNSLSGNQALVSQWGGAGSNGSFYIVKESDGTLAFYYSTNGASETRLPSTFTSFSTGVWYHIAIVRDSSTIRFFVDGVSKGTGSIGTNSIFNSTRRLNISTFADGSGQAVNGWMDEIRISKGIARWTTDFTPPISEYTSSEEFNDSESLLITDSLLVQDTSAILDESLLITDTLNVQDTSALLSESLLISDSLQATIVSLNQDANFGVKIISYNPLVFVTDTAPAEIGIIDTTDPENLTWEINEIVGVNYAKDAVINLLNNYIYVACASGIVVKINLNDLQDQEIIDLSDTDDIINISNYPEFGITYASTNNSLGELYIIDERQTFKMDSDFQALHQEQFLLDSDFNLINVHKMDSAFTLLSENKFLMGCDFKCNPATLSNIKETDYRVYIDDIELVDPDLILDTIQIIFIVENETSEANFSLSRKHDNIDRNLDGDFIQISNKNNVRIDINGITKFTGKIGSLDNLYDDNGEIINVTCYGNQEECKTNNITISLPSLNEDLSLYHVLINNPVISNPDIDPNSETPIKYKGIKAPFGHKITQQLARYLVFDSFGSIADSIQDGSFIPRQNWTYFWHPTVSKFGNFTLGQTSSITFDYIGTSLSPISSDLWNLTNAKHRRQRIFPNKESRIGDQGIITIGEIESLDLSIDSTELFNALVSAGYINGNGEIQSSFISSIFDSNDLNIDYSLSIKSALYELLDDSVGYYVGEAPFKQINPKNGWFIPKERYEDGQNGLYLVTDEAYDYREFVKKVADLEYDLLKNINGDILPDTQSTFVITIDAYLYYDIKLLTRINIDNTIQDGIYKNNNGFPLAVKSITIDSSTRQVTIQADNLLSNKELELIESNFPDDIDEEYIQPAKSKLFLLKSDMRTGLNIE